MKNLLNRITIVGTLAVLIVIVLTSFYCSGRTGLDVVELKIEYESNPVGIDTKQPRFSWVLQSDVRGEKQTAYQILVASKMEDLEEDTGDLWDSGKIDSEQSIHIPYKGQPLGSNKRYYLKVRVWNKYKKPVPFSPVSTFTTGLLTAEDWKAKWIGRGGIDDPPKEPGFYYQQKELDAKGNKLKHNPRSLLLRKSFKTSKKIKQALLHVSGLGLYELSLNGSRIGESLLSPAKTFYKKIVLYDTYDVSSSLQKGENAIGIMLGNGWFNPLPKWWSWRMQWFGSKRAIMQLHLLYMDGSEEVVNTDETWKVNDGPILSSCIYDGEIYDANQEIPGWDNTGFDDAAWSVASILPSPGGKMTAQVLPPIKETELIKPQKVTMLDDGNYVVDLGQNISGWLRIKVSGSKGTEILIKYAENLNKNGRIDPKSNNLASPIDTYIMSGKENEMYEPRFTYHGFRYVEISGAPNTLNSDEITGVVVHSAVEPVGSFACSNEDLNRIHAVTLWSQRANLMGLPTDCPQRDERLGWLGDAHVTAEEAIFNFDMALFYEKWLNDIQSTQRVQNGDIPYISPRPFTDGAGTPAWSSAYHLIVWYMYLYYGDKNILDDHYESMRNYVDYLSTTADAYILPSDNYGDWLSANRDWKRGGPLSVSTGYYYYVTSIVAETARILEQDEDQVKYEELSEQIKDAYNKKFYNYDTQQYEEGSQFSNSYPLFLGIASDFLGKAALGGLVVDIMENKGHLNTGILGTKYMLEALSRENHSKMAYLMVTQPDYPGWINLIQGRTTFSEHWNQTGSNNHVMFGSVDSWFYKVLAGISIDEEKPGFENVIIKPYIASGLDWVKAHVKMIRGEVGVEWQKEAKDLKLAIQVPVNSTATVYILANGPEHVEEERDPASTSAGVTYIRRDRNYAVYQVNSGRYEFRSKNISSLIDTPYASKPVISPPDTSVFKPESLFVHLSTETDDAEIRYTLDNSKPTKKSELYTTPILLQNSQTVNARTFKKGYHSSFNQSADISFVDPEQNGLLYRFYEGAWTKLPKFSALSPTREGIIYRISLDNLNVPKYDFGLEFEGFIQIEEEGKYTFYTQSNDGSKLYVGNKQVVDNDLEHLIEEKSGSIKLSAGRHPFKVTYFQSGGGIGLDVLYKGPGIEKQTIPPERLFPSAD